MRHLPEVHDHWNNLLSTYSVKSSDEKLDRMVNIWNQYQCVITFSMSRSASYYETAPAASMGFRDSCRICSALCIDPRPRAGCILDIAAAVPRRSAYPRSASR